MWPAGGPEGPACTGFRDSSAGAACAGPEAHFSPAAMRANTCAATNYADRNKDERVRGAEERDWAFLSVSGENSGRIPRAVTVP